MKYGREYLNSGQWRVLRRRFDIDAQALRGLFADNRRPGRLARRQKRQSCPDWFWQAEVVRDHLLRERHFDVARKWLAVIIHWFIDLHPDYRIEEVYGWKPGTVGSVVQKIRRALRNERLDGKPRTGRRRGRPKREIPDNRDFEAR